MLALAAMEGMVKDMYANRESLRSGGVGLFHRDGSGDWLVAWLGLRSRDAHHHRIVGSLADRTAATCRT